jgi:hypothetical protein
MLNVDATDRGVEDVEVPLQGGNTRSGIVRVGDTVRRPTGPWTAGVHHLLRHLESGGFNGAPRVIGVDDQAREVLTFVQGPVVWPDYFDLLEPDGALAEVATCIRHFHDCAATFDPDSHAVWSDMGSDPVGPYELMCHNDLAPWNLVRSAPGWVFIDWDLAAPGRRLWDLAWAVHTLVPLWPDSGLSDETVVRRIRRFCAAYGMVEIADDLVDVAAERCRQEVELIRTRGAAGIAPYERLLIDGHDVAWQAAADHIESSAASWRTMLATHWER